MLRSKSILPWGVATLALVGAGLLAFRLLKSESVSAIKSPQAHVNPIRPNAAAAAHIGHGVSKTHAPTSPANSGSLLGKQEEALVFLHDTSVTYDPAELPKIQPYLLSPDAEVQKAAIDAMVVLGDAAAAPMLREASRQTMDTNAVMEMLKAADYLELPPMDIKKMAVLLKNNASSGDKGTHNNKVPGRPGMMAKERQKRIGTHPKREAQAPEDSY
jgi:hypothetical protein